MNTNFHVDLLNGVEVDALQRHLEAGYLKISGFGNFPFGFGINSVRMPNFNFLAHLELVEQLCGQTTACTTAPSRGKFRVLAIFPLVLGQTLSA